MSPVTPDGLRTLELPIQGMDCAECTQHVHQALCTLPGVADAQVYLSSEKAVVHYDAAQADKSAFRTAVEGAGYSIPMHTVELQIVGMDCAECSQHVQQALAALPGVEAAQVLLSSEKAVLRTDPTCVDLSMLRKAVEGTGYRVAKGTSQVSRNEPSRSVASLTRPLLTLLGLVFGAVLLVVIAGEWLGLLELTPGRQTSHGTGSPNRTRGAGWEGDSGSHQRGSDR
jgi:copper ion binding protein